MSNKKIEKLNTAIFEAERFIVRAKDWKDYLINRKYAYTSKEGSACKRASMDLTRALAELRKPG